MGANSKGSRCGQGDISIMYRHEVVLQCRHVGKSLQIRDVSKAHGIMITMKVAASNYMCMDL